MSRIFFRDFIKYGTKDHGQGPLIIFGRSSPGTQYDEARIMRTLGDDVMRVDDHDPVTGECLGFLSEVKATALPISQDFANDLVWPGPPVPPFSAPIIDTSFGTAPDGTLTTTRFEDTGTDTTFGLTQIQNEPAFVRLPGETLLTSMYVRKDDVPRLTRYISMSPNIHGDGGVTSWIEPRLDTMTGETGVRSQDVVTEIFGADDVGDFWRFWTVLDTSDALNTDLSIALQPARNAGSDLNDSVSSGNFALGSMEFWGLQVIRDAPDNKERLTSFVPFNAPGGVREADNAWVDLTGRLNSAGSAVIVKFVKGFVPGTYFQIDDGTDNNRIAILRDATGLLKISGVVGGASTIDENLGVADGDTVTVAFSTAPNDFAVTINGDALIKSTAANPTGLNRLCLMNGDLADQPNSHMHSIQVFDEPLSDGRLFELLTPANLVAKSGRVFERDYEKTPREPHGRGPAVDFSRSSIATHFDAAGVLQTAADNVPRFDHDPVTGEALGYRGEVETTYIVLNSESFSAPWTSIGSPLLTSNLLVAPDGTTTMDETCDNSSADARGVQQIIAIPATNLRYTYSVFVEKKSFSSFFPEFRVNMTGGAAILFGAQVNLLTGATIIRFNSGGGAGTVKVTDIGAFWRVELSLTNVGSNTSLEAVHMPALASGGNFGGVNLAQTGCLIHWGHQAEQASFASSYRQTLGTAATRNADVASVSLSDLNVMNSMFVKGRTSFGPGVWAQLDKGSDTDYTNRIERDADDTMHVRSRRASVIEADLALGAVPDNTDFRVAARAGPGDYAATLDGAALIKSVGPITTGLNTLRMMNDAAAGLQPNGTLAAIGLFNVLLRDDQLRDLVKGLSLDRLARPLTREQTITRPVVRDLEQTFKLSLNGALT